jgi:hypothetical protein
MRYFGAMAQLRAKPDAQDMMAPTNAVRSEWTENLHGANPVPKKRRAENSFRH